MPKTLPCEVAIGTPVVFVACDHWDGRDIPIGTRAVWNDPNACVNLPLVRLPDGTAAYVSRVCLALPDEPAPLKVGDWIECICDDFGCVENPFPRGSRTQVIKILPRDESFQVAAFPWELSLETEGTRWMRCDPPPRKKPDPDRLWKRGERVRIAVPNPTRRQVGDKGIAAGLTLGDLGTIDETESTLPFVRFDRFPDLRVVCRSEILEPAGEPTAKLDQFKPGDRVWHSGRSEYLRILGPLHEESEKFGYEANPFHLAETERRFFAFAELLQPAPEPSGAATPIPEQPTKKQEPRKEDPMNLLPIKIETVVLVDGTRADCYDASQCSQLLEQHETEIKRLEALEFKTLETVAKIADLRAGVAAAIKAFDEDYLARQAARKAADAAEK